MDEQEKKCTAYHEAGHALVAILEPESDPVHKITIIPRGMALGLTAFLPEKDKVSVTRRHLLADLAISMGGRVAEELFLPDVSTGARQDLQQATRMAHAMVCDWGLSEKLGPRTFGKNEELVFLGHEVNRTQDYSEETARLIDEEVTSLLRAAHARAKELIESHRDAMEALVAELLEKETVDGPDAEDIVKFGRVRTPEERGETPPPAPPPVPPAR
jgi:cell division protease FtsH